MLVAPWVEWLIGQVVAWEEVDVEVDETGSAVGGD